MSLKLDLPHSYELEPIEELPGSGQLPHFISVVRSSSLQFAKVVDNAKDYFCA